MTSTPAVRRLRKATSAAAERAFGTALALDERMLARHDPPRATPVDTGRLEWSAPLEARWADLRAELDDVLAARIRLPRTDEVAGAPQGADGAWTTYLLTWYGRWVPSTTARCPVTASLLRSVPGLQVGGYTVLGPRTHVPAHRGPTRSLRYHLPLKVPGPPGACRLRIGDEVVPWVEGRGIAFDDRTEHEAWNDSDEPRYVFFVQTRWPTTGIVSFVDGAVQHAFGRATRLVAERAQRLDDELNDRAGESPH